MILFAYNFLSKSDLLDSVCKCERVHSSCTSLISKQKEITEVNTNRKNPYCCWWNHNLTLVYYWNCFFLLHSLTIRNFLFLTNSTCPSLGASFVKWALSGRDTFFSHSLDADLCPYINFINFEDRCIHRLLVHS